jgi:hypothetical protein
MTFQAINLGSVPNDATGDDLRTAGGKINANFGALFSSTGLATTERAGLMSPEDKVRLDGALTDLAPASPESDGLMSSGDKAKLNGIVPEATKNATDAHLLARGNHTGTQAISTIDGLEVALGGKAATSHPHPDATTSAAGFMPAADKAKLNGIATGATANATDAQLRDRSTHTGTQVIGTVTGLQAALDGKAATSHPHPDATPSAAGFMPAADKAKLNGIATGATANATDAQLRDRSTHTGTQPIGTVTGLQAALDGKAGTALATTTIPGLMSAADKVRLNSALTEVTGQDLTVKAVPVAADQIVIFDSQAGQTAKLVPVSAFALASDLADIRKIVESI